jgi:tol-pal system protein YbgF
MLRLPPAPRGGAFLPGFLALLFAPACLTSTQATRIQKDLEDVKRQVFQIQQETAGSQERLAAIDRKLGEAGAAGSNAADVDAAIGTLLAQIEALGERMRDLQSRMSALQEEIQSLRQARSGGASAPRETSAAASPGSASAGDETFAAAYADYSRGNYELAVMGFSDFLKANRDHPLAPDAQYWIGECLYSQGKFGEAADAFEQTVRHWPTCDKAPAALLKEGLAQMELGRTSRAVTTLQRLIQEHPASEEARIAAERLKGMGLRSPDAPDPGT